MVRVRSYLYDASIGRQGENIEKREERREPLTYKSFFIQTWPMGHNVCGVIVYTKNEFFGPKGSGMARMDILRSYRAQLSPRKPKSIIISP